MLSNACFFRVSDKFELPALDALEAALQKGQFVPCGPTQPESAGWVAPRSSKSKQLAEIVDGHLIVKLQTERKPVPASAVKAAVEERVEKYKQETGAERVPAKLKKEFKEEVLLDLLPRAFAKRTTTLLWLDPKAKLLIVDAGSLAGADRVVSALLAALLDIQAPDLDLQLLRTQTSPAGAMAHWLMTKEAPWNFTVDRDCELKAQDEQKSAVRYSRHTLETDEVAQHIAAGKVPTQLAMTWSSRVSFTLTEGGTLRKIKMLDVVLKQAEDGRDKDAETFDAEAFIATSELSALIPDLLLALGGEVEQTFCEHCGGNDETPPDHTRDCTRPAATSAPAASSDDQYDRAVAIVREHQRASISLVQRHLQIGYNRAATLLEEMEKRGIVSAMNSQGARTILCAGAVQ